MRPSVSNEAMGTVSGDLEAEVAGEHVEVSIAMQQ
jgi:hypothetical protein